MFPEAKIVGAKKLILRAWDVVITHFKNLRQNHVEFLLDFDVSF